MSAWYLHSQESYVNHSKMQCSTSFQKSSVSIDLNNNKILLKICHWYHLISIFVLLKISKLVWHLFELLKICNGKISNSNQVTFSTLNNGKSMCLELDRKWILMLKQTLTPLCFFLQCIPFIVSVQTDLVKVKRYVQLSAHIFHLNGSRCSKKCFKQNFMNTGIRKKLDWQK